ncbi:MAG: phytanoyl-CoA dioxygenase family protein [Alphaproteobacteria bacterium]
MQELKLSREQTDRFNADGVVMLERIVDEATVEALRASFDRLFRGAFETGVTPDEVNWQEGTGDPSLTRQICNGWKADRTIARVMLREDFGRALAGLSGWPGARIMIDDVLWKPPGARPLGFHQDDAYLTWFTPQELISLWIALDDTSADGGTMEVVRGSHTWAHSTPEGEFHGPEDYRKDMELAARAEGSEPEIVPIVVNKGGGSIHHGWVWHGSGHNRSDTPRRALVLHAMSSSARYVPERLGEGTGSIYGRYKRLGDNEMDENYFPILWSRDGRRTPGLDEICGG